MLLQQNPIQDFPMREICKRAPQKVGDRRFEVSMLAENFGGGKVMGVGHTLLPLEVTLSIVGFPWSWPLSLPATSEPLKGCVVDRPPPHYISSEHTYPLSPTFRGAAIQTSNPGFRPEELLQQKEFSIKFHIYLYI